jgi:hypothetical protein
VFWKMFDRLQPLNGTCHRHAPMPGLQVDDTSYWPETMADDGCAEGIAADQNSEPSAIVPCAECVFWFRRGGQEGLVPARRGDLPRAWWHEAAYCACRAPAPESNVTRARWRATHASDGCGDGQRNPAPRPG